MDEITELKIKLLETEIKLKEAELKRLKDCKDQPVEVEKDIVYVPYPQYQPNYPQYPQTPWYDWNKVWC